MAKTTADKNLVSILATPLRIREDKALPILMAYAAFAESVKAGNVEEQLKANLEANAVRVLEVKHNDCEEFGGFKAEVSMKARGISTFKDVAPGSIAVVPVRGVMMRESFYSWDYGFVAGTRQLEQIVKAAERSPNISAIVFQIKTPGGEAAGNESLARVINNCSIPTLGSFEGMASAGLEAFIGLDENYALEKDSYYGSLGTLTSIMDASEFWANMGVKIIDIYAPQSTLKNIESREAREGNTKLMEERLAKSTAFFIEDVKKARPQMIDDGKIFKGAVYNAVEAVKIKAIDGIKDFDFVINRAAFLARKSKRNNTKKIMLTAEEKKAAEEKAAAEKENKKTVEISKEDKSIFDKIKAAFTPTKKGEDEPSGESTELAKANQEIGSLKASIVAQQKTIEAVTAEKVAAEQKAAELEADCTKLAEAKVLDGEEPFKTVAEMVEVYNKTFDHNKELGGEGKAANLPIASKETTDVSKTENNGGKIKSLAERRADIDKRIAAKKKAKKEAKDNT